MRKHSDEFSQKIKKAAFERSGGKCEMCGFMFVGRPEYDHRLPVGLGGEPTLENCVCACSKCHTAKTHEQDRPIMAKADRQRRANDGTKARGKGFRGWRKMNGEVVWRD